MIGKAIGHYLELKNLTQVKLSELTEISPSAINQYLKGSRNPSDKNIEIIARALGISVKQLKEVAESFAVEPITNDEYIDERMLQRRLDFIYGNSDLVLELSKYVLISFRSRTHDLIHEINERKNRPARSVVPRDRARSPIESITEKVFREFLSENLDEIAHRIQEEMKRTETSVEEIIDHIRNQNKDFY